MLIVLLLLPPRLLYLISWRFLFFKLESETCQYNKQKQSNSTQHFSNLKQKISSNPGTKWSFIINTGKLLEERNKLQKNAWMGPDIILLIDEKRIDYMEETKEGWIENIAKK